MWCPQWQQRALVSSVSRRCRGSTECGSKKEERRRAGGQQRLRQRICFSYVLSHVVLGALLVVAVVVVIGGQAPARNLYLKRNKFADRKQMLLYLFR